MRRRSKLDVGRECSSGGSHHCALSKAECALVCRCIRGRDDTYAEKEVTVSWWSDCRGIYLSFGFDGLTLIKNMYPLRGLHTVPQQG